MDKKRCKYLSELMRELDLYENRLQERMNELSKVDASSLEHDILLMEIELLNMLISASQELIDKKTKLRLSSKTKKAVFLIKSTAN